MHPKHRTPSHTGEILLEEFLKPLAVTQVDFAAHIGVPIQRVNEIVRRKRDVSPETAWLFAGALGTTPEFWVTSRRRTTSRSAGRLARCGGCTGRVDPAVK
jgi:addiction module HigA family antidote